MFDGAFVAAFFNSYLFPRAHTWLIGPKGGNIVANAAGGIDQLHGKGVSVVDDGLEKVAAQKLAG